MIEKCSNCKHCKTLYTPPTTKDKAKYELCCVLFLGENSVMYLSDGESMCECFQEKGGVNNESQHRNDTGKQIAKKLTIQPGSRTLYVCPSCNAPLAEAMKYCYNCYRKLDWSVEE